MPAHDSVFRLSDTITSIVGQTLSHHAGASGRMAEFMKARGAGVFQVGSYDVLVAKDLLPITAGPDGMTPKGEPVRNAKWYLQSALFPQTAQTWLEVDGSFGWRVHPSRRQNGPKTIVALDKPVPANAAFSAVIVGATTVCPGVELEFAAGGQNPSREVKSILGPLGGKMVFVALRNAKPGRLTVQLQSVDSRTDNVDACWLTFGNVQVLSLAKQR